MLQQTDGKGQSIQSDYDARGRVWRKRAYTASAVLETESLFNFDYDPATPGPQTLGALVSESIHNYNAGSTDNIARAYSYDGLGRAAGKTHTIDGATYAEFVEYDALGRTQESRDATGRWLRTEYADNGYASGQCEGDGSDSTSCSGATSYVKTVATDTWGHAISETRGPVSTARSYDPLNDRLLATCSGLPGVVCGLPALVCSTNCPLQDEHYTWDNKGNLLSRSRGATYTENFKYDANDRVTLGWYSMLGGTSYPSTPPVNPASDVNVTEWMSYDKLGNICQRMGTDGTVNAYTYSQLGGCGTAGLPGGTTGTVASGYRLLKVAGSAINETYATDANGSMTVATSTTGTVLRGWNYDTQNRAVEVFKGATPAAATLRTRWDYDASGARFRRTDDGTGSGGGSTTLYLDNVERVTTGSSVTWRRTVAGVAVMALIGTNPTLPTTNYLLHDHIGSVVAVANSSGALVERGDYSAFGGMRTAIDGVQVGLAALATTTRGFTGHEQLGSLDLIHMNGRIYDPLLGRFLQADPMVQSPGNPQNWNPYSYVFNNPLANTDPTGMFSVSQFFQWAPVVLDVLAFLVPAWAPFLLPLAQAIRTLGAVYGDIKGGVAGAFTAVANYEFGITGAAIAAGVISESRGGSFWVGARREAFSDLERNTENYKCDANDRVDCKIWPCLTKQFSG